VNVIQIGTRVEQIIKVRLINIVIVITITP
jgi:hypothetical protein